MKMIFFGDAARDSGNRGFSEAWPLQNKHQHFVPLFLFPSAVSPNHLPSCPHGVHIHPLRNIDNQLDVGIIIIIGSTGNLDVLVGHANIVGVGGQIFGRGHHSELDSPLVAEGLVSPFPHRANLFDSGDTVVGNKHLGTSQFHVRFCLFFFFFSPAITAVLYLHLPM